MRISCAIFGFFLLFLAGCDTWQRKLGQPIATEREGTYAAFAPVSIEILPLTKAGDSKITAYVSLLDSSVIQIKWPGTFRFEIYEAQKLSGKTKGRRVAIWSDIDLSEPAKNKEFWQDFIRAYKFELDFKAEKGRRYVLVATFLDAEGKRISSEYLLSDK